MLAMVNAHKENSQALYEANYRKLTSMLPDMAFFQHISLTSADHSIELSVDVMERTPYTVLLEISSRYRNGGAFLPATVLKVRVYHDASVAEVISVQGHKRIRPHYHYPNEAMYLPDEKRQGNQFFSDLLKFCGKHNYQKTYLPQSIEINS